MDPRTKTRIALGVAIACGALTLAWRITRSKEAPRAASSAAAPEDTRGSNASPQSNGDTPRPTATATASVPVLDRKRADEMREQIHRLMAEAGVAWALPETPSGSRPAPAADGLYPEMPSSDAKDDAGRSESGKYIQRRVREDLFPLAKDCYAKQLEKNPKLAGRFVMHFRIVGDRRIGGVVDTATMDPTSTLSDPEFSRCMTESMMSVTFDAPPSAPGKPGEVTVTYPIEFSPDEPDGGDAGS